MCACCLLLLLLLLLAWGPGAAGAPSAIIAQTLAPCYSADLQPASGRLISAVSCTVLLAVPPLNASAVVFWEYKNGPHEEIILKYYLNKPVNTAASYKNRTKFNETDFSLQMVLQRGDSGTYRFRTESQETDWFQLEVIEPLPAPEIVGNSSVKAGGSIKLVCNIPEGKADSYWWKKNGELLLGSDHFQFVRNNTLHIIEATMNDSGYYACVVRNKVSQNETSFLLRVQNAANMVLPVMMACVIVGSLIGVLVWCRRRGRFRHCVRRWRA
ncbi:HEPACAM family member 2-like [Dromaius novaehollandiae]|uniref:HEPACAM family member 2-like n=1 Tax=Dromaius novaehollandiae TaxID=8790 RepID=UPI00311EAF5E